MLVTVCTAVGLFVFECKAPNPTLPAARFCQTVTGPVRYSATDTAGTRRQLRSLNAKWRAACQGEKTED